MAVSCGPVKYTPSDVNIASIREFAFIEPVSDIMYYGSKNRPVYDPDLSIASSDFIESIVSSQRYPFSDVIPMDYEGADRNIRRWIQNIGDVSTSRIDRMRVPNDLRDIIAASGYRYGVVIYLTGYVRSREAIRYEENQEAVSAVVGAVLDALTSKKDKDKKPTPTYHSTEKNPYDSNLYCVVIDSEDDRVIHYVHPLPFLEKDPFDGYDMEDMLSRLLKDFE